MEPKNLDEFLKEKDREEEDIIDYNTSLESLDEQDNEDTFEEELDDDDEDFERRWYPS